MPLRFCEEAVGIGKGNAMGQASRTAENARKSKKKMKTQTTKKTWNSVSDSPEIFFGFLDFFPPMKRF